MCKAFFFQGAIKPSVGLSYVLAKSLSSSNMAYADLNSLIAHMNKNTNLWGHKHKDVNSFLA